jgi:hypothetical protein
MVERTSAGASIHWARLLDAVGEEQAAVDRQLAGVFRGIVASAIDAGPKLTDGPVFAVAPGRSRIDIRSRRTHAAIGFETLVERMFAHAKPRPTGVVFVGAEVCVGNNEPGADCAPMLLAGKLEGMYDVPFRNVQVVPPLDGRSPTPVPDSKQTAAALSIEQKPSAALLFSTPSRLSSFVNSTLVMADRRRAARRPAQARA